MKKVSLNFIVDNLTELGWDYSCGRMSRSGMEIYDGIMRHVGILFTLVLLYFVNRAYFNSPLNQDKK